MTKALYNYLEESSQTNPKEMKDWHISYDIYTDKLQIRKPDIFKRNYSDIECYKDGDYRIDYDPKSNNVILIEIDNLYDKFTRDISKNKKSDIIKRTINLLKDKYHEQKS